MDFCNATGLDSQRLYCMFLNHTRPYRHDRLKVRVRYSRGADFSGTCFYRDGRIFVNLGRHLRYPYEFGTHLARAEGSLGGWRREIYRLTVANAYELALFIYLHELFHYLIKAAGRCPRRKEAMCDRFAAAALVDTYGCPVRDGRGRLVPPSRWRFQDLHAFVAAAPRESSLCPAGSPDRPAFRPVPVRVVGVRRPGRVLAVPVWLRIRREGPVSAAGDVSDPD